MTYLVLVDRRCAEELLAALPLIRTLQAEFLFLKANTAQKLQASKRDRTIVLPRYLGELLTDSLTYGMQVLVQALRDRRFSIYEPSVDESRAIPLAAKAMEKAVLPHTGKALLPVALKNLIFREGLEIDSLTQTWLWELTLVNDPRTTQLATFEKLRNATSGRLSEEQMSEVITSIARTGR